MIQTEIEDILGVLRLCAPYLIALGIALLIGIVVLIACRKLPKSKKFLIRGNTVLAMILATVIVANLISFGPMSTIISLSTGSGTISDKTIAEATSLAEEVAGEGMVLLENNDNLLPLTDTTRLNLFGWASSNPVYGGAGSGGINDLYPIVSLQDGLKDAGFEINQGLVDFYGSYTAERPEMSIQKQSWTLPEPPASTYPAELIEQAKSFSDVAVIVLSRMAGEGHSDMPTDVSKVAFDNNSSEYNDFSEGEHYLELSQTEKDMIDLVTSNFDQVVLVYNGANPFELGFVNDYDQIKSVLWAPGPGNAGFDALGDIVRGTINPSGRTPDTFVYDMTASPWWENGFKRPYANLASLAVEGMNNGKPEMFAPSFINYAEGIYVGYKYYETAAKEGAIDYDQTVQYPFGHGLSYTTFKQEMGGISETEGALSFEVTVTNTGSTAGKDVVEVYYEPPYTNRGIEKSSANLVTFQKTGLLEPGQSETVEISFNAEDMASYDAKQAKAYVLEQGDYIVSVNSSSHVKLDERVYSVDSTILYNGEKGRASDVAAATNRLDESTGAFESLSRADGFANYVAATATPTTTNLAEPFASEYHLNSNYDYRAYLNDQDKMPVMGAKNGMKLAELRGANYDDPRWDKLLDQMSVEEMMHLTSLAGYQTAPVESVDKAGTVDADGPAAINNSFTKSGSIGFPVAVLIASTWSQDIAMRYGEMMGKMAREMNVAGWYAPGINIHRITIGGRNYEYYSEDGLLSGKIAANTVAGAKKHGVYSYIKHFALYDSNGKMVNIWADEQTVREIYLKPFEISVKEGKADAVMVGWNFLGHKWVGENSNLNNGILRDEWGFRGFALTDFFRNNGHGFMNADMAFSGGVDAMLSTYEGGPNNVKDPSAPTTVKAMRQASKNIMYTVVNSWVYEDGDAEVDRLPWQKVAVGLNIAAAVLLLGASLLIFRKYRKMNS
ncbi:Thermostable beta-glucosidase B [compost metagenome]